MSDWDEDDDRPAEFPWLLWIPVLQAIAHTVLVVLTICCVIALIAALLLPLTIIAVPIGLGIILLCVELIRGCVRILAGKSDNYWTLFVLTFTFGVLALFLAIESRQSSDCWILAVESVNFLVSALILWFCGDEWEQWRSEKSRIIPDTVIHESYYGGDHEGRHGLFNTPPN